MSHGSPEKGGAFVMKAVKLRCGTVDSTDSRVSFLQMTNKHSEAEFHNLILLNQKYTYLQIVDTFSYGFRKYSTI